tara:strand:- start:1604 stop:2368 length:765 start_codon:yes stop_codon:yes gene_type:complete
MSARLGVNIDHVATLREARGESYPSLENAAEICLNSGADQITIHLREDRRHIQDKDVPIIRRVTKEKGKLMNLEMGCDPGIIEVALMHKPDWVCLVPEKREEQTTEGGLNLIDASHFQKIKESCIRLKDSIPNLKISLFVESDLPTLEKVCELGVGLVDAVEIHTGDYAIQYIAQNNVDSFLKEFERAKKFVEERGIACHAGHGLTNESVAPLIKKGLFEEYNIGHWIISESVFLGLEKVVRNLKELFEGNERL